MPWLVLFVWKRSDRVPDMPLSLPLCILARSRPVWALFLKIFFEKIAFLARNHARSGPKSGWNPRYEHQWKLNSIPGHYQSFEMNYMGNGWFSNEKNAKFGPKPLFRARLGGLARFWARNHVFFRSFCFRTSFEHLIWHFNPLNGQFELISPLWKKGIIFRILAYVKG